MDYGFVTIFRNIQVYTDFSEIFGSDPLGVEEWWHLHSKIGKGGGYVIVQSLDVITLGRVIRLIDGSSLVSLKCLNQVGNASCQDCVSKNECVVHHVMKQAYDSYLSVFDETTLQEMVNQEVHLQDAGAMTHNFSI